MTHFDRTAVRDTMISAMASLVVSLALVGAAVLPAQAAAAAALGL
jgi:hypothetical protein